MDLKIEVKISEDQEEVIVNKLKKVSLEDNYNENNRIIRAKYSDLVKLCDSLDEDCKAREVIENKLNEFETSFD